MGGGRSRIFARVGLTGAIVGILLLFRPLAVASYAFAPALGIDGPLAGAPPKIATNDNRRPAGKLRDGVLTLRLEVRPGLWYPEEDGGPALPVLAFAETGQRLQIPGPLIRVPQGTEIRVSIRNPLRDSTLTMYGLQPHPAVTDSGLRIPAGVTREVRFRAHTPGTYHYWATVRGSQQPLLDPALRRLESGLVRGGFESQLAGAFVVDPPNVTQQDRIFVMTLWRAGPPAPDAPPGPEPEVMAINGKSWPHTERLAYARGDSVRWRWVNATDVAHPMHLHGFYFHLESKGDWKSELAYREEERPFLVTHMMLPGETMRISWMPSREGNWLFHCHFAFHVSHHLILPRAEAGDHSHPGAEVHRMAGLVLGIHVGPGPVEATVAPEMPVRSIRLIAQTAPARFGPLAGMGYVVQEEGTAEPPRDSIAIPGPTLVLTRGQPVRITVVNHLAEPTAVHWHGIELESFSDGVPGWSGTPGRIMPPIAPRDSFVAEFVPPRAGTFIYHTHSNEQLQLGSGLYGALLVLEPGESWNQEVDKVILVGGAGPADSLPWFGFESPGLVNGDPAPAPLDLKVGTTYRLRFININPDWRVIFSLMSDSAMATWRPVAEDGADLPVSRRQERPAYLLTGPGQTADFEFTPSAPGTLRLEVKTQLPGWLVPIEVRMR